MMANLAFPNSVDVAAVDVPLAFLVEIAASCLNQPAPKCQDGIAGGALTG